MTTPTKLMSLEEFLALPETKPATELIDGVPCQKPVGRYRHGRAQTRLAQLLGAYPSTEQGEAITELTIRFPAALLANARIPDVCYFLPASLPDPDDDYPSRAPDLAAEVLSKGQSKRAIRDRLAFLRSEGTQCTLFVDPWQRIIEAHDGTRMWTAREGDEVTLDHLAGFRFSVRRLFD